MKTFILLLSLIISVFSQTTSLADIIKDNRSNLPPNCLEVDQTKDCIKCNPKFSLWKGECIEGSSEFSPNDQFVPCGNKDNCGQAENFKNVKEFDEFVEKFSSKFRNDILIAKLAETTTAGPKFSTTNNQVIGVDEADMLKTDGTYIYTISNKVVSITQAYPSSKAKVLSQINFKEQFPTHLFIQEDFLAVIGTILQQSGQPSIFQKRRWRPNPSSTFVKIYDVSNRKKPFLVRQFKFSGGYFNGRKLENGFVYLITTHDFFTIKRPWYDFGSGRNDVRPSSIFWYPGQYQYISAINIISFNLGNPLHSSKKVVTICAEQAHVLYMSQRYIYLTNYHYENGQQYTKIRKIFVRGSLIRPFADGKVKGSVNNQFSLDEYGQFLRIATTSTNPDSITSNNIFVLNFFLNPYGELTGIAKGQRIFSVRYTGKRCFIVTFRQVDPFFVISFSNHRKPQILGELKIPGFSRYLHIYDEDAVIGLGRQADGNGVQLGLKISVFDVSDVSNPKESAKFQLEQKYASSNAEWEHKAFLFQVNKNLLVIPGYLESNGLRFNGAFAFFISKTEITMRGAIDHVLNQEDKFYQRYVERSLYIQELLYTKSSCLLRINKISKYFEGVKNINLPCSSNPQQGIVSLP